MDPLPIFCFLLILEVGLGCKTEYTRKVKQGTSKKNIRQGRQTDSFEPICELRDPRRFLQALVVSQLLQPIGTGQARQGRRHGRENKLGVKEEKPEGRKRRGAETKKERKIGQRDKKKWGLRRGQREKSGDAELGRKKRRADKKISGVKRGEGERTETKGGKK